MKAVIIFVCLEASKIGINQSDEQMTASRMPTKFVISKEKRVI